jgi:hypothetical protein
VGQAWKWAKGAWGKLQKAWEAAKKWLAGSAEGARKWISGRADAARKWVAGRADEARNWINGKADSAIEWMGQRADKARGWIKGKADTARQWIDERAGKALDWIKGKADAARDWISGKADAARGWIAGKSKTAQAWIKKTADAGVKWFGNTGHSAVSGLGNLARSAASTIRSRGGRIGRWFGNAVGKLVGGVESVGHWAVSLAGKALDGGLNFVSRVARAAVRGVERMGTWATNLVGKASTGVVNLTEKAATGAVKGVQTAGNGVVNLVGNAATGAVNWIEDKATAGVNLLRNVATGAVNKFEGVATRTVTWLENKAVGAVTLVEKTIKVALALVKASWTVVKVGWGKLKEWLGKAFGWVWDKVCKLAGWVNEKVIKPVTAWVQKQWENLKQTLKAIFPGLVACWEAYVQIAGKISALINRLPIIKEIIYVRSEILKGAVLGDFIDKPNIWNIIGQIAIGFVPYAGQIADARDIIASIKKIREGKSGAWFDLCLNVIAFIPGVGDLVKAGGKHLDEVGDAVTGVMRWFSKAEDALKPFLKHFDSVDEAAAFFKQFKNVDEAMTFFKQFKNVDEAMTFFKQLDNADEAIALFKQLENTSEVIAALKLLDNANEVVRLMKELGPDAIRRMGSGVVEFLGNHSRQGLDFLKRNPDAFVRQGDIGIDFAKGASGGLPMVDAVVDAIRRETARQATELRFLADLAANRGSRALEEVIPHFADLPPNVQNFLRTPPSNPFYRAYHGSALQAMTEEALEASGAVGQHGLVFRRGATGGIPDIQMTLPDGTRAIMDWTTARQAGKIEKYEAGDVSYLIEIIQPGL